MRVPPPEETPRVASFRLADEAYADLRARVRRKLPAWLARGTEDPGWVLLEALADELGDLRAEAALLEEKVFPRILESLGEEPRWARAAGGVIAFSPADGAAEPVLIPRGTVVAAPRRPGEPKLTFETVADAWASPSRLIRVVASAGTGASEIFPYPQGGWDSDPVPLFAGRLETARHLYVGDGALLLLRDRPGTLVLEWAGSPGVLAEGRWEYSARGGWKPLRVELEESRSPSGPAGLAGKGIAGRRALRARITGPLPDLSEERLETASSPWIRISLPGRRRISIQQPAWVESDLPAGRAPAELERGGRSGARDLLTFPRPIERLLSQAGERWEDHSLAAKKLTTSEPSEDEDPALHLGWESPAHATVYWALAAGPAPAGWGGPSGERWPAIEWEHSTRRGFRPLEVEDGTRGFTRSGATSWKAPPEWTAQEHFGERLHWVRARWTGGAFFASPAVRALIPHAAEIRQGRAISGHVFETTLDAEGLAVVDLSIEHGEPERFSGIEVRTESGWKHLADARVAPAGEDEDRDERDLRDPGAEGRAEPREPARYTFRRRPRGGYAIDVGPRLSPPCSPPEGAWTGPATFRIPSLRPCLGARGNLPPGTLTVLEADLPGVRRLIQPLPTDGGRDAEGADEFRRRIRAEWMAGGRAVTGADYERLARAFDPGLARVEVSAEPGEPGHVLVHVVAAGEGRPGEVAAARLEWLAECLASRAPLGTVVEVAEPLYLPILAVARPAGGAAPPSPETRRVLEERIRTFLHPLRGGEDGRGFPMSRWLRPDEISGALRRILGGGPPAAGAPREGLRRGSFPGGARRPGTGLADWDPASWRIEVLGAGGEPLADVPAPAAGPLPLIVPCLERLVFEAGRSP